MIVGTKWDYNIIKNTQYRSFASLFVESSEPQNVVATIMGGSPGDVSEEPVT